MCTKLIDNNFKQRFHKYFNHFFSVMNNYISKY